jgi:hypothetical protein
VIAAVGAGAVRAPAAAATTTTITTTIATATTTTTTTTTTAPFSTSARHANSLSLTERLRRKRWGTDAPPGAADPYGGPGEVERLGLLRGKGGGSGSGDKKGAADAADAYEPATTWDDLEVVGDETSVLKQEEEAARARYRRYV